MKEGVFYWNVEPEIFWITDTFPLKYYGLCWVTGILIAYFVLKRIYLKENKSLSDLENLTMYIMVGAVLGARLGHCLFYDAAYYLSNPLEILLPIAKVNGEFKFVGYQGLASHGGTIGALIGVVLYCKKYKTKLLWVLDRIAIVAPITAGLIRLGNFMNSEIYGKPTNGNWGVVFQRDDLIPRHPTQLYEAFSYFTIFIILFSLYWSFNKRKELGVIFGLFLILLFLARFSIEFFKENQVSFEDGMALNMGQLLSIPFILIGILLIAFKRKWKTLSLFNSNQI